MQAAGAAASAASRMLLNDTTLLLRWMQLLHRTTTSSCLLPPSSGPANRCHTHPRQEGRVLVQAQHNVHVVEQHQTGQGGVCGIIQAATATEATTNHQARRGQSRES